jgi:hypothetical protein
MTPKKTHRPESDAYRLLTEHQSMQSTVVNRLPDHSHEWRGTWKRPVRVDEKTQHPFTLARMTDHNVKGRDD